MGRVLGWVVVFSDKDIEEAGIFEMRKVVIWVPFLEERC
jgi:hypothetical protein